MHSNSFKNVIHQSFKARPEAFICYGDYGYSPNYSIPVQSSTSITNRYNGTGNDNENISSNSNNHYNNTCNENQMTDANPKHKQETINATESQIKPKVKIDSTEMSQDDISFNKSQFTSCKQNNRIRKFEEIENYEGINDWNHQSKMRKIEVFEEMA